MSTSRRRTQAVVLFAVLVLCYILFFSSEADKGSDFRGKTEAALRRKHSILAEDLSDEDYTAQTNNKLQEILAEKDGWKAAVDDEEGIEDQIPVAGRKTMPKPKQSPLHESPGEKPKYPKNDDANDTPAKGEKKSADPGEDFAREELQQILKRSPIIIFSKSYCPYSKRAKRLLLNQYDIQPAPYVVELDQMTKIVPKADEDDDDVQLGRKLQDLLKSLTHRGTVPNILINTKSIGGSDEVVDMDSKGTLLDKILEMGGKRIVSATRLAKEKD
jgi:glutaredoxin